MGNDIEFSNDITQAAQTIKRGGLILYPTDTIWGIGCDATNSDAVRRVFDLKRRADSKALITLVATEAMLERHVAHVPDIAWQLIDATMESMLRPNCLPLTEALGSALPEKGFHPLCAGISVGHWFPLRQI